MTAETTISRAQLFELELAVPNDRLTREAERLVGFGERYRRLHGDLQLLLDREGVADWSERFYKKQIALVNVATDRYPLVIFHGDVGTGKTATAETASNALAAELRREGMLLKLSTRVRGAGRVGEMSMLINQAFNVVTNEAGKSRLAFLILDEADSLAASRDGDRSHHEDKVAVNTLIQKIDAVREFGGRILVFLCTNRFGALDPAILRRAGRIERFDRPDDREREALFRLDCDGLGISDEAIRTLVRLTGPVEKRAYGFTYSDIRSRLLPEALARVFPDRAITEDDLVEVVRGIEPSPRTSDAMGNGQP